MREGVCVNAHKTEPIQAKKYIFGNTTWHKVQVLIDLFNFANCYTGALVNVDRLGGYTFRDTMANHSFCGFDESELGQKLPFESNSFQIMDFSDNFMCVCGRMFLALCVRLPG